MSNVKRNINISLFLKTIQWSEFFLTILCVWFIQFCQKFCKHFGVSSSGGSPKGDGDTEALKDHRARGGRTHICLNPECGIGSHFPSKGEVKWLAWGPRPASGWAGTRIQSSSQNDALFPGPLREGGVWWQAPNLLSYFALKASSPHLGWMSICWTLTVCLEHLFKSEAGGDTSVTRLGFKNFA